MRKLSFLLVMLAFSTQAQVNVGEGIQLRFTGYVSHEIIYDTYRSLDSRDGELYFYPLRAKLDSKGVNINKQSKLNMVEVQSRFGMQIKGPDLLGAKTNGLIEADFFGTQQNYVRLLRLRHAYVNLNWGKHEFLAGNTFHPTFVLDCFPNTVSFAAAVPFHPLNRSPQLRYTFKPADKFKISTSFLIHGYHRSQGPSEAQKNSGLPDSQLLIQFGDGKNTAIGAIAGYKWLTPRDVTENGYSTAKKIGSYNVQGYMKHKFPWLSIKLEGLYGQNMTNFVMIGGYGVKAPMEGDPLADDYDYTNLKTLSAWFDLETSGKVQFGFFGGYTASLGADHDYIPLLGYTRDADLAKVLRFSPRVVYKVQNLSFGFEWSVITATYGNEFDSKYKALKFDEPVTNNHIIFNTKYSF